MVADQLLVFCRILIALVFILSLVGKLRNVAAFQEAITDFELLPERAVKVATWAFLAGEALVIVLLVVGGGGLLAGFGLAIVLLALFSMALLLVLRRKLKVVCNCFGQSEQHISGYDVARNALLIVSCLGGLFALRSAGASLSAGELALLGLMAAAATILITNLADIAETVRQPVQIK